MSTHTNESRSVCENSVGDGCRSCIASLFQPVRRAKDGRDCPGDQYPIDGGADCPNSSGVCEAHGGSRLVLLTVMAFVLPVVVTVVVVQSLESRVGSAAAAFAGLAAAGLTAAMSALIVRRVVCRSAAKGADQ